MNTLYQKSLFLLIIFISVTIAKSQGLYYMQFDPVSSATGLTASNTMAYAYNPSLFTNVDVPTLVLSVAPSRFGISELSPGFVMLGLPVSDDFVTAFSGHTVGNSLYNEFSGSLHGAYSISEFMDIGASFEYFRLSIQDFRLDVSYQFHIGANVRISDLISAAVCVKNINGNHYLGGEKTINQAGAVGLGFHIAQDFTFDLGLQVSTMGQSGISLAGLYTVDDILNIRLSALTSPRIVSGAVSVLAIPYFDINLLSSYQDYLGWSNSFGLSVYFGKVDE